MLFQLQLKSIMVVEAPYGLIFMVQLDDLYDLDNGIQQATILFYSILCYYESNTTTIHTIGVDTVACKLMLYHHV